jgi:hypothetical protein
METFTVELDSLNSENITESALIRQHPDKNIWLWHSNQSAWQLPPDEKVADLEIAGYHKYPIEDNAGAHLAIHMMLQSQILESRLYSDIEGKNICFTTSANLKRIVEFPVILGSIQGYPETVTSVRHPSHYPPKEHGTIAIVIGQTDCIYPIGSLPLKAQERQKKMSQLVEDAHNQAINKEIFNVFIDASKELKTMVQQLTKDYY